MTFPTDAVLLPQHQKFIEASGISPEVAAARGYRSVTKKEELVGLGFADYQQIVPALLVPVHNVTGAIAFHQVRPDAPRTKDGKPAKYETRVGVRMVLDVPPEARATLGDPRVDLYITEGSRKADAAVSHGLCCISLLGVWNWRGRNDAGGTTALADWESIALNGRTVYIVFDSDVTVKPEVQKALKRLCGFLESRGAIVTVLTLPAGPNGTKAGFDDYLAGGGKIEDLIPPVEDPWLGGAVERIAEAKAPTTARALTTVNLGDVKPMAVDWLWANRLPRGNVSLVVGDPGLGKSKVTLDIASRRSRGKAWPDGQSGPPPGHTILLTAEDNLAATVRPRVEAMGGDPTMITVLQAMRDESNQERPFSLESDLRALDGLITEVAADLIIIDPLSAYLGKVDSHNDAELRRVLGPLAAMAERMNVAVLCIMHLTKDVQRKALYRTQGSIAFTAAARSVLAVVEDKDIPDRRLFVSIKSNLGPKPPALAFIHDGPGIRWEDQPVPDVDVEALFQPPKPDEAPARRAAEQFLREALKDGPRPAEDVKADARANGIPGRTLDRAKAALKIKALFRGVVGQKGVWAWSLAPGQGAPGK